MNKKLLQPQGIAGWEEIIPALNEGDGPHIEDKLNGKGADARRQDFQSYSPNIEADCQSITAVLEHVAGAEVAEFWRCLSRGLSLDEIKAALDLNKNALEALRIKYRRAIRSSAFKVEFGRRVSTYLTFRTKGKARDRETSPTELYGASSTWRREWWPWAPRSSTFTPVSHPSRLAAPIRESTAADFGSDLRTSWFPAPVTPEVERPSIHGLAERRTYEKRYRDWSESRISVPAPTKPPAVFADVVPRFVVWHPGKSRNVQNCGFCGVHMNRS